MFGTSTTPQKITPDIITFCKKIDPSQSPVYVPVIPEINSRFNECFYNVEDKIRTDGGKIQYGWMIWELPNVVLDAEFHAVWVSASNQLIDVTQKRDGETQILFLPDSSREWIGEWIDNIRSPLNDNKCGKFLIAQAEAAFEVKKKYLKPGRSELTYQEATEYQVALMQVEAQYGMHKLVLNKNDICCCGSGRKYKKCHGANMA